MRSGLRKKWDDLYLLVEKKYRGYEYREKARIRLKKVNGGYPCKKEYRETVLPYWKRYGQKPGMIWWRLWGAETKQVDPRYIPDDMWFEHILPYFSNTSFRRFGEDKCYHGIWFADAKRPETVAANIAGVFYDDRYQIITEEEAVRRCAGYGRFLIKPSIDSGEGRLIRFFDGGDVTEEQIREAFHAFGSNFVAQEVIRQHPDLAALNSSSLNTIRIVSFLWQGEVYVLSAILRMGGSGARLDNIGAGGYACALREDGRLSELAVNRKSEWCEENQNGVKFRDVRVPSYNKAVALIQKLHKRMAHFKLIGWDIGIDQEGDPVLIEFNSNPGQNQYSCGPTFGDLTEQVLEDVFIKKTLASSQN